MRYFGTVTHRLDNKNRLTIPSTFLDKLGSRVYLTKNHNNFLELRDEEVFASFTKNLSKTIKNPSELSMFKRMFFKNTIELKIDSSNRILIKEDLKSFLNITNEISFVGVGEKIEL
jgi:MraZ protein